MADDGVPSLDYFRPAILRVMADGQVRHRNEIYLPVADQLDLSESARNVRISSGGLKFKNRTGWAITTLIQAGLLERPNRGYYRITDDGKTVDARGLKKYTEKEMYEWEAFRKHKAEVEARRQDANKTDRNDTNGDAPESPIERIEAAVDEFNAETETALRNALLQASPEFFEKAVIELLWAMGYGGPHGAKQHVGKSGDGGIDGVIRQDALGLHNLYVQAKRYDNKTVGSKDIREFYGALATRGTNQGVFITLSSFTSSALKQAESYKGKIILIDGIQLTRLMLQNGVAVEKAKDLTLYEVDEDFFEEETI